MPHDDVTFGLAAIGFAMLAADACCRLRGQGSRTWTTATVAVVLAHVACVWSLRFDGSLAAMWQKSAAAFLLFHGAATLLVVAPLVREPWASRLVVAAFVIVCAGALPAPFRYPELAVLRLPLLAITVAAVVCAVRKHRGRHVS